MGEAAMGGGVLEVLFIVLFGALFLGWQAATWEFVSALIFVVCL